EYAVGASTVANGWPRFFQSLLPKIGIQLPEIIARAPIVYDTATGHFVPTHGLVNLPAVIIVTIITIVLVKGIQESATFNATMVGIKLAAVLFVVLVGSFFVNPDNWRPMAPYGWGGLTIFGHTIWGQHVGGNPVGMSAGARLIFSAF